MNTSSKGFYVEEMGDEMYNNPVNTIFGRGSFEKFLEEYKNERLKNGQGPALFIISRAGLGEKEPELRRLVKEKDIVIDSVKPNPDLTYMLGLLHKLNSKNFKRVIGIGGGSVMDAAKMLKALLGTEVSNEQEFRRVVSDSSYEPVDCGLILIPTTAGTGSEKTKWATLWDEENTRKYSVEHPRLYADKAYIDPAFTDKTPPGAALIFALDAFCHAVESFWSPKSGAMTREYSLSAVRLFVNNIERIFESGDTECRDNLSLASLMAANAFSQTKTSVCHAVSYQLTLRYNVPHGLAAWMTLPWFLEFNRGQFKNEQALYNALDKETAERLKSFVAGLLEKAGLCYGLADYGFREEELNELVKGAFVTGRSDNNPVTVTEDAVRGAILSAI